MGNEIERKFLVRNDDWRTNEREKYRQGYISTNPERTVRVRISENKALFTIKGISSGPARSEFEYEIPKDDAEIILNEICERPIIEKYRTKIKYENHTWEVDEFEGENQGLVIAEIELASEDEDFKKPPWVGKEVTSDSRYYNANLVKHPLK